MTTPGRHQDDQAAGRPVAVAPTGGPCGRISAVPDTGGVASTHEGASPTGSTP